MSKFSFKKHFKGKTVIVTGHTGFKGSWLTLWLISLGANVIGISSGVPGGPSHRRLRGGRGCRRSARSCP